MTQLLESLDGGSGTEEDEGDEEVEREREDLDVNQAFLKEEVMQESFKLCGIKKPLTH